MIVFEMFGHLGELVFAAEAEHGAGLVDVDDALSVHAERGTAVLEHHSATRHGGLAESRRFWSKINGKTLIITLDYHQRKQWPKNVYFCH